jgi:hypothetical protein
MSTIFCCETTADAVPAVIDAMPPTAGVAPLASLSAPAKVTAGSRLPSILFC